MDHHTLDCLLQVHLCDKPQPTATHSQAGKWQPSRGLLLFEVQLNWPISLLLHFRGSHDCFHTESGRVCSRGHVMFVSISRSDCVPLWFVALKHQTPAALCWTAGCLAKLTQLVPVTVITCKWRAEIILHCFINLVHMTCMMRRWVKSDIQSNEQIYIRATASNHFEQKLQCTLITKYTLKCD